MKKIGWTCVLSAWIMLSCCACGTNVPAEGSASSASGGSGIAPFSIEMPYVGILLTALDSPYYPLMKAGAEDEADARGVQVMVVAPDDERDTDVQASLLQTMAGMAIDVLIVAPNDEDTLEEGLALAADNGKFIMAIDTDLTVQECACFIGTDQYAAAYEEGGYAAELVGSGSYAVILRGENGKPSHDAREQGITDALRSGGVYVLDTESCDPSEEQAEQTMAELLSLYRDIDVVCATSIPLAVGAQKAIEASGRSIRLVCFDSSADIAQQVLAGEIDAAIAQDAYEMGRQCIQRAVQLFHGQSVERYCYTEATLITQTNAADYITTIEQQASRWRTKR